LNYEIDGIVYKINALSDQKRLGHSSRAPRYAVAEKFPAHDAMTHIIDIDVQVGRTGIVTPVAHLHPVLIGGVRVTRASMHNANEIQRKDLRIGDTVLMRRAGDVIPQIMHVILEKRPMDSLAFVFPQRCPCCHSPLVRKKDAVAWRCPAGMNCAEQAIWRLRHCVSRDAMDITGLGIRQLTFLYQQNLVLTPADLFRLRVEDLMHLEGWGQKSAEQLILSIDQHRELSLHRWIYALGIPCVGYVTAKALADHYKTRSDFEQGLDQARDPTSCAWQELLTIPGVGHDIALELLEFRALDNQWIEDLASYVRIAEPSQSNTIPSSPLYGKSVVFTGTLPTMTRAEAKERAEQCGARVLSGLSKQVDFLVCGEKSGQKIDQARSWQITILDAQQWIFLLENNILP
jgi:DNA ligase (NAD+)